MDKYKIEKANRKEQMKKDKIKHVLRICGVSVVALVLVGWIGYSGYNLYETKQPRNMVEVDYSEMTGYLNGISGTAQ